jgi:hypothetical protein
MIDMSGRIVGSIRVLSFAGVRPAGRTGRAYWNAECLGCGKRLCISGARLREREREGRSPSCGCMSLSRFTSERAREVGALGAARPGGWRRARAARAEKAKG